MLKPASGKPIITMTTEVAKTHASIIQGPGEVSPAEDHQVVGSGQSQGEAWNFEVFSLSDKELTSAA